MTRSTMVSKEDASVNHVLTLGDGQTVEARFVQRTPEYFICYLSSHTGCSLSCRFCHLTATGQTVMNPVQTFGYREQAEWVMQTYDEKVVSGEIPVAQRVHFNFMARGEAMVNPDMLRHARFVYERLEHLALVRGLESRFLISTIMPREFNGNLGDVLCHPQAIPYYSLYSVNPTFRKRWLPKAMDPVEALARLAQFQRDTDRKVVLHWAFIAGQNDSFADVDATLDAVEQSGLKAKFNLVRYNPHDSRHGVEPPEAHVQALFDRISVRLGQPGSRIVPRVGFDVKASCGMFVNPQDMAFQRETVDRLLIRDLFPT